MNKDYLKLSLALIAVLCGVFAIIKVIPDVQLAINMLSLSFGIMAIIWTLRAFFSLSEGTTLRQYTFYFLISLILIISYSIWDTLTLLFGWGGRLAFPKYFFITAAYLMFVFASYNILRVGKLFGFQDQVNKMSFKRKKN